MGAIEKIIGKVDLGKPDHKPEEGKWNLPFAIELHENFHIHWQDIRIEMDAKDFDDFVTAMVKAREQWIKDGKPNHLPQTKWYGRWPGEENMHFYKDRLKQKNEKGEICHHFRYFPRTESGKRYYDNIFQIEKQRRGQYHIHYKNFRWELGEQIKKIAEIFKKL